MEERLAEKRKLKIVLVLATLAPALFGCISYIIFYVPILGDVWWVVAPFAVLLYWNYVGGMYYTAGVPYIVSLVAGNLFGIVSFAVYMFLYYGTNVTQGEKFADQIIFWFTYPLQFLTMSAGILIKNSDSDGVLLSYTQIYGLLFMLAAFSIGWWNRNRIEKKERRRLEEEADRTKKIHEATHLHR